MTIGQVAKKSGLAASAIRYYEAVGVLQAPTRRGGKRQYDRSILERLALVERAKACGYSLAEVRHMFYGFPQETSPGERWRTLARQKLAELDELSARIAAMRDLLQRQCECRDLDECGQRIFAKSRSGVLECNGELRSETVSGRSE